jgi:hypothetical protein
MASRGTDIWHSKGPSAEDELKARIAIEFDVDEVYLLDERGLPWRLRLAGHRRWLLFLGALGALAVIAIVLGVR